jgi:hypothetical protein
MQSIGYESTFRKNMSPPFPGSKNKKLLAIVRPANQNGCITLCVGNLAGEKF